jgi:PKD repeat protein
MIHSKFKSSVTGISGSLRIATLLAIAVFLVLIVQASPTEAQASRPGTSGSVCSALVQAALNSTDQQCSDTTRNQACYGNVLNEVIARANASPFTFEQQGDKANLFDVDRLELSPLDIEAERWGVVLMQIQANLPGSLPGQNVTFLMFGDTVIQNDNQALIEVAGTAQEAAVIRLVPADNAIQVGALSVSEAVITTGLYTDSAGATWLRIRFEGTDNRTGWVPVQTVNAALDALPTVEAESVNQQPMQAFYFRTGIGQPECIEAPRNGVLVQTPQGAGKVDFTVNGVDLELGSTAFMTSTLPIPGDEDYQQEQSYTTCIAMFDGEAVLGNVETDDTTVGVGFETCIDYDEDGNAVKVNEPEAFDPAYYRDLVPVLGRLGIDLEIDDETPGASGGQVFATATPTPTPTTQPVNNPPADTPIPFKAKFRYTTEGDVVFFENRSIGPVASYLWDFGDGTTSTQPNPVKDFGGEGAQREGFPVVTITLTVTTADGQSDSKTLDLTLYGSLYVEFIATATGLDVTFESSVFGYYESVDWDFGDGQTDSGDSVEHAYDLPGTYSVTVTANNPNESVSFSQDITVDYSELLADFTWTLQPDGYTVQFTDLSSGSPDAWSWDFGDEGGEERSTATEQNPSFIFPYADSFYVELTISRDGELTDLVGYMVDIPGPLTADFGWDLDPMTFQVQFYDYSLGDPTSWDWDFGDGNTSTQQSPVNLYAAPGTYNVELTVSDGTGTESVMYSVEVGSIVAGFYYYDYGNGYLDFYDNSVGVITYWNWDFGDGTLDSGPFVTHQYIASGTYTVVLTVTDEIVTDTYSMDVSVTVPLAADFQVAELADGEVQFTDVSLGGATSWDWDFGDGNTSTAQNPSHTYAANGSYDVSLTASDGVTTHTLDVCISVTTVSAPRSDVTEPSETASPVVLAEEPTAVSPTIEPDATSTPKPDASPTDSSARRPLDPTEEPILIPEPEQTAPPESNLS